MEEIGRRRRGVQSERLKPCVHLDHDDVGRIRLEHSETAPRNVDDRQVGNRAAVREAPSLEVGDPAALEALAELVEETRLPDPWLAQDPDHSCAPFFGTRQDLVQHRQLPLAADEPTERDAADLEPAPLVTYEAIYRPGLARHRARWLQLESTPQELGAARVQQDRAGLGISQQRLEHAPHLASIRRIYSNDG